MTTLSVVIPAKNEATSLVSLLPRLKEAVPDSEIIIVNDGSTDETAQILTPFEVKVITHSDSRGNGAAIKSGARAASGDIIVFMDADGQHDPKHIPLLVERIRQGDDLVVGARNKKGQASVGRGLANAFYNWFASKVTGFRIQDLTSGFRAARAEKFREFLHLLPNGFSYPTTSTMAFLRSGFQVSYIPIEVSRREGKSHIKPVKDGIRFLIIIFKIATLYAPLKVFLPISAVSFGLGLARYIYTYMTMGTFTNMSALLFVTSVQIFLIGLVSEQITSLIYKDVK
ncbi:glycosyltransferase family 2 protein [Marinobacter pelagius]|uniref:glycosyltransferase family 2 protein n=1 Tax=Marinobacter sp. C7 TaxID=2951363 RepID=UPI001EEFAAC1|nr:glycosyltransferase family 2 protein [Marinobacter sp. C7]MCG7199103.1 glycosyltransferase family 2 protein [Marinobacter sp. C7]